MSSAKGFCIRNSSVRDGSIPMELDLFYQDHATVEAHVGDDGGIYLLATDRVGVVIDVVYVHQMASQRTKVTFLLQ